MADGAQKAIDLMGQDAQQLGDFAAQRQTAFDSAEVKRINAERAGLTSANAGVDEAYQAQHDIMSRPRPQVDMPSPNPPQLNPKDYEGLSYALIGLALVGGAKGMWTQASASLNGALKGYLEGNQQQAQEYWTKYQADFKSAKDKEARIDQEIRDKLDAGNLTINEKLQAVKSLSAQYGLDDMRAAAEQKSIDLLWKQADARRSMWETKALSYSEKVGDWANRLQAHAQSAAGGGAGLTDDAITNIVDRVWAGDKGAVREASAYDKTARVRIENAIAERGRQLGKSGTDIVAAQATLGAETGALRQTEQREAAIHRLTGSLKRLEPRIMELAQKVVPTGTPRANVTINWVRRHLTDNQDQQEFDNLTKTAARFYIEAATMPGSNAQMHASSQQMSDSIINGDMSLGRLQGAFNSFEQEFSAVGGALGETRQTELDRIRGGGGSTPAPAGASPLPQGWSVKVH